MTDQDRADVEHDRRQTERWLHAQNLTHVQTHALAAFARRILALAFAAALDGADAQELALALGLLHETKTVVAIDGEDDPALPLPQYELAPWLREEGQACPTGHTTAAAPESSGRRRTGTKGTTL